MARASTKKKPAPSPSGSILSFFKKPAASSEDVKPDLDAASPPVRKGKGKGRAPLNGSAGDPVVISDDDEEDVPSPSHAKRQRPPSPANDAPIPRQSCSPPPEPPPPPIAGLSDFRPPPTWPQIVNTASHDEVNMDVDMGDGIHPDGDGSQVGDDERTQDPGEDEDAEKDDSGVEIDDEIQVLGGTTAGAGDMGVGLNMSWEDERDEGMGMEDFDGEFEELSVAPRPKGKKKGGAQVDQCPVCQKPLKGLANTFVQKHINTCLDTPSNPKRRKITSINHTFSPAPSSPSPPPDEAAKGPNAFSVLMSGHKEREQWKDAEIDLKRDGQRFVGRRKAPFYKVLTGMPVAVDAFRYGAIPKVTAYLLTHAHSDHYTNLSKAWHHGPIYCSETTANLIIHMLGVEPQWVHGLPDNIPFEMPNTGGVTVMPIEANHCPGSSIFLFEGPQTVNAGDSPLKSPFVGSKRIFRYLHCGDFRACPKMVLHPAIARAKIDTCYLDTTYLNPKYCFPPQPQVIEACAVLARRVVRGVGEGARELVDADDVKPVDGDVVGMRGWEERRSKRLMEGWVGAVKKEDVKEEDVKEEGGLEEDLVRRVEGEAVKLESMDPDIRQEMDEGLVKQEPGTEPLVEVKAEEADIKPKSKKRAKERTLVVMGTYSIGKERIVKAVAKALGSKIYCDPRKKGILLCQTDPELHSLISSDPHESQVHLLPLGNIQLDNLQPYLTALYPHFDRVLGFRPTGWTYTPPAGTDMLPDVNAVIRRDQSRTFTEYGLTPMRGSCKDYMMYGVPYSEHSSFFELTCFALSLPGYDTRMIATVNVGNEKSRAKMKKWFEKWAGEKQKRREKNLPKVVEYRDENYW